jgi:hypothetical protein
MDYLRDRRVIMGIGGAFALIAAVGIALGIKSRDDGPKQPPPASQAGLIVDIGAGEDKLDTAKPLRCFVGGQFVGMATLADCASKNGVATNALDVGVDETGALAAASQTSPMITPLPPVQASAPPPTMIAPATALSAPVSACWSHVGDWRRLAPDMGLNACVQTLFAGRCEKAGAATYGRWGDQTLRLVPGKVEVSSDNRTFRTLVDQPAGGCGVPSVGN